MNQRTVVLLLVGGLLVAACGGEAASPPPGTASTPTDAATTTSTTPEATAASTETTAAKDTSVQPTEAATTIPATSTTTVATTKAPEETPDPAPSSPPCTFEEALPRILPSVVQVVTEDGGAGTAFYIDDDLLVTAAHVVVDAGELALSSDRDVQLELIAYDTAIDLAFLRTPGVKGQGLDWADSSTLQPGAALAVVGYPTGVTGSASITDGRLSRLVERRGDITFLQTNAESNPGNSGGPIITVCGEVAGVVVSKMVGLNVEGIAFAVGASTVRATMQHLLYGGREVPMYVKWSPAQTQCMTPDEQKWLRTVSREVDRIVANDEDFLPLFNEAGAEKGSLVENDPTWFQAVIAVAFRYEAPALAILDLLPAPTPELQSSERSLKEVAAAYAAFAQALPRAIQTDPAQVDAIIAQLTNQVRSPMLAWIEAIEQFCST